MDQTVKFFRSVEGREGHGGSIKVLLKIFCVKKTDPHV